MSKRCMGCMELFGDEFEVCPHCGYAEGTEPEEAIHMEPGTILNNRYIIGKVLGYGGFGVTYIAWDGKLEQKVAVKEYLPSEFSTRMPGQSAVTIFNGEKREQFQDGMNKFIDEARRLAKFQNEPGIVCVYDSFSENDTAYIIMEYLEGETLTERLKRDKVIPEDEAVEMMLPVMQSLKAVHEEGILHRDIAPDNIFLTKDGGVKLIDFGASRYATTSHSRSLSVIIKPGYSPEEQYRSRGDQGPHTDVYALAATLYKMITGKTPPDAMERRAKIETKKKDILEDPTKINKKISVNRENAILNAMNVRIEDRTADIDTLIAELNADPPAKRRYGKIKKIDIYSWPLWLKIVLPVAAAAIVVFGVLLATGVIHFASLFSSKVVVPDGMAVVPDVEGMNREEAFAAIEEAGLQPSGEGTVISQYVEEGCIILQTPLGGTFLKKNEVVALKVCVGDGTVIKAIDGISTVPFIEWETEEDAIAKLLEAGLGEPEIEYVSDEKIKAGLVISQSVVAGEKIEEGTKIKITVSTGPAEFDMPNVVGKTEDEARNTITGKGMVITVGYEKNNSVAEGTVISQSIPSGKKVRRGDAVTITVCSGKATISVPNVVGMDSGTATSTLDQQGFSVSKAENYDSTVPKGVVISQSPEPGSNQMPGATVTIVISKGPQPVTVPGVVGSPEEFAKEKLSALGLGISVTENKTNTSVPIGSVISQSPEGGASVMPGTVVTIEVRRQPDPITISFDAGGGSASSSSISVIPGNTYGSLPSATKTGFTFNGWFTEAGGGAQITGDSELSITAASHTLYAHWTENPWSGWTDTLPSDVTESGYFIETKTEYRYKTRSTTTGSSKSMDGWTLYDSKITSWGNWSAWQNNAVTGSDSRQVETQVIPATYGSEYNYNRWMATDGSYWVGAWQGMWNGHNCTQYQERGWGGKLDVFEYQYGGNVALYNRPGDCWFNESSRQYEISPAYTQYRYRDGVYTYYFEKWSDWSSWSETAKGADGNTKVETRTMYRYRKK